MFYYAYLGNPPIFNGIHLKPLNFWGDYHVTAMAPLQEDEISEMSLLVWRSISYAVLEHYKKF